jgi:hypothetical protein
MGLFLKFFNPTPYLFQILNCIKVASTRLSLFGKPKNNMNN